MKKYYGPIIENLDYLHNKTQNYSKILEIGPGKIPFKNATHFVDHKDENPNTVILDINNHTLPWSDDYFDFAYCRHVLEDINNPEFFFRELTRVARRGYIETPSPIAEFSRNTENSYYRGYIHHFSFVWKEENCLTVLHKYPVIEYMNNNDKMLLELLEDPFMWNTYYEWDKDVVSSQPKFKFLKYDIDYDIFSTYNEMIEKGISHSVDECIKYRQKILKGKTKII